MYCASIAMTIASPYAVFRAADLGWSHAAFTPLGAPVAPDGRRQPRKRSSHRLTLEPRALEQLELWTIQGEQLTSP